MKDRTEEQLESFKVKLDQNANSIESLKQQNESLKKVIKFYQKKITGDKSELVVSVPQSRKVHNAHFSRKSQPM